MTEDRFKVVLEGQCAFYCGAGPFDNPYFMKRIRAIFSGPPVPFAEKAANYQPSSDGDLDLFMAWREGWCYGAERTERDQPLDGA